MNRTLVCSATIERHAFVDVGAVVHHYISDFALVVSALARQLDWIYRHGEQLDLPTVGDGRASLSAHERPVRSQRLRGIAARRMSPIASFAGTQS